MWLVPTLFGSAVLKPLTRYFQTQSLILPMLFSSFVVLSFHIPACWTLVYKLELGSLGAAIAFGSSTWLYVILLSIYVIYSSVRKLVSLFQKMLRLVSQNSITWQSLLL
jgi:MATE family multidrug resistance protein